MTPDQRLLVGLIWMWGATVGFGWLWWRYYRTGKVYRGRWYRRDREPFSYWLVMVSLAAVVGLMAAGAVYFMVNGL